MMPLVGRKGTQEGLYGGIEPRHLGIARTGVEEPRFARYPRMKLKYPYPGKVRETLDLHRGVPRCGLQPPPPLLG